MITPKLTENIVFDLVNSVDEFPVDFDLAWKWLEFTRKDNAKRSLTEYGFVEGIDFCNLLSGEEVEISKPKIAIDTTKKAGVKQNIRLTNECFKSWAMMAATEKGKEVRKYFINCERKMKELAANPVRTDWVLADLMENDVLASAVAALAQLFLSMGKEEQQGKPSDIDYTQIGKALWVAAMTIQAPSPEFDEEADVFPPEVEFDNQRWCSMLRDALVMLSPAQAAKWLTEVAERNPDAGYFRSFPISVAIPGYQRAARVLGGN